MKKVTRLEAPIYKKKGFSNPLSGLNDVRNRRIRGIVLPTAFLLFTGILVVYTASSFISLTRFGNSYHYLVKHIIRVILGVTVAIAAFNMPYRIWKKISLFLYPVSLVLLLLTVLKGFPLVETINGSSRWLQLSGFRLMPSELIRFSYILFSATLISRRVINARSRIGTTVLSGLAIVPACIMLFQPDFTGAVYICSIMIVVLFLAEARISHMIIVVLILAGLSIVAVFHEGYRLDRIEGWQGGEQSLLDDNFQPRQASIALGSGGLLGRGLGRGRQQRGFLPEAFSDFILAVVGEEAGFLGVSLFIIAILVLLMTGWNISADADDCFGAIIAGGITGSITIGALINIGVTVRLLPTTGMPFPLVSWGGSNILVTLLGLGIIGSIAKGVRKW